MGGLKHTHTIHNDIMFLSYSIIYTFFLFYTFCIISYDIIQKVFLTLVDQHELHKSTYVPDHTAFSPQFLRNVPINHSLDILQDIEVDNLKPAVVKIYDYYQTSKYVPDIREWEGVEEGRRGRGEREMQTDILGYKMST